MTKHAKLYIFNFIDSIAMRSKPQKKANQSLKQQFQHLIQTLRNNAVFNNKPHLQFESVLHPLAHSQFQQETDITPITQNEGDKADRSAKDEKRELEKSQLGLQGSVVCDHEIEIKEEEVFEEEENADREMGIFRGESQLLPDIKMTVPVNQGRIGQIKHQNTSVNLNLSKKIAKQVSTNILYSKIHLKPQSHCSYLPITTKIIRIPIKELNDIDMIKYWNTSSKITQTSPSAHIYRYFQHMIDDLSIDLVDPIIQKYKNCVYFGHKKINTVYQGIIYYFNEKIYYGEFLNGIKHGHGVEINFSQNIKYAGMFNAGSKNGFFFVQKEKENYQGTLQYGLYHGQGKLMTEEFVYTGAFQNGNKHGYGEEVYPKTGLKLQGYFKEGNYQNLNSRNRKKQASADLLPNKIQKIVTLQRSDSYDMKVQLTSKLLHSQRQKIQKQPLKPAHLEQQIEVPQLQFQQDSKSLFDLIQNCPKNMKYDMYIGNVARRLPKIHLQGLKKRQKSFLNPQDTIINFKVPMEDKQGRKSTNFHFRQKVTESQLEREGHMSELPLFSRRNMVVQSPIHRL